MSGSSKSSVPSAKLSATVRIVLLNVFNKGMQQFSKTEMDTWLEMLLESASHLGIGVKELPTKRAITSALWNWRKRAHQQKAPITAAPTEAQSEFVEKFLQRVQAMEAQKPKVCRVSAFPPAVCQYMSKQLQQQGSTLTSLTPKSMETLHRLVVRVHGMYHDVNTESSSSSAIRWKLPGVQDVVRYMKAASKHVKHPRAADDNDRGKDEIDGADDHEDGVERSIEITNRVASASMTLEQLRLLNSTQKQWMKTFTDLDQFDSGVSLDMLKSIVSATGRRNTRHMGLNWRSYYVLCEAGHAVEHVIKQLNADPAAFLDTDSSGRNMLPAAPGMDGSAFLRWR